METNLARTNKLGSDSLLKKKPKKNDTKKQQKNLLFFVNTEAI